MKNNIEEFSTITCPICGFSKGERMPTDACQWFYECENCKTVLQPKEGDCCVFCSYGSVACPPVQETQQRDKGGDFSKRSNMAVEIT